MLETIFCKHYQAMSDHDTCKAGVAYDDFKGLKFDERPCFMGGKDRKFCGGCDKQEFPTAEEVAAKEAMFRERLMRTVTARAAIVQHLGGDWKRGMAGSQGAIDCPVCSAKDALRFSRSGYNGHIHAACKTENCVRWME